MTWKMFLRISGKWSLAHLCNKYNECVCGWKYLSNEFTEIKNFEKTPFIACDDCKAGTTTISNFKTSTLNQTI